MNSYLLVLILSFALMATGCGDVSVVDDGPSCDDLECEDGNPCTVTACDPDLVECTTTAVVALTTCKIDGSFGSCVGTECDLGLPPPGDLELSLELMNSGVSVVSYQISCASDLNLSGTLGMANGTWGATFDLPAGECNAQFAASDQDGEVICMAGISFDILPDTTTQANLVLICNI